jgi:hypothetical protein
LGETKGAHEQDAQESHIPMVPLNQAAWRGSRLFISSVAT